MPIFRFVAVGIGKALSKVFGLATMAFFGRLPSRDDDRVALVGVASLTWVSLVVASLWPALAELFIPFVDDEDVARIVAIVLTVVVPLVIGGVVATMHNNRDAGAMTMLRYVLSGYVYALVIGCTMTAIVITVPLLKASYIVRRFKVTRMMVMIPDGRYDESIDEVRCILERSAGEAEEEELHPVIRGLFRMLGWILGRLFDKEVPAQMRVLRGRQDGDWFEVTVHAADVSMIGNRRVVHRLRAALAEHLGDEVVYLTWDDDAQQIEDDARDQRARIRDGEPVDADELDQLVRRLAELQLDQEPWDALRRLLYRLELENLRVLHDHADRNLDDEKVALEH